MNPKEQDDLSIFNAALEIPAPEDRAAYLDGACAGNPGLRGKIESLLAADANGPDTFEDLAEGPDGMGRSGMGDLEKPGMSIGRYKLLEQIGEGGMGVVYMAEQREPVTRKVALKIIKLGMDTRRVVARFEAERQALAMMDHPNIARVLDGGATETGRPYFVMELVQGAPITEFCDENKLPAQDRVRLFIQVCHAIQSAHQKGVIHRDIKPSNVLVTLDHGEPCPKVIDFGIAKATNQRLTEKTLFTRHATMIGTPAYMCPEQAEMSSADVDTRADVYSLGVLLYELLTGTTPFPDKRLRSLAYGEMQRVIAEEEPERPSTRLKTIAAGAAKGARWKSQGRTPMRDVDADLDWIVLKCLEKDRARRYDTANGLASDLKRHLENEPVAARPPSSAYRFQKAFCRHKLAFAAGTAVVLALLAGLVATAWQWRRAERQRAAVQHRLYAGNMNLAQAAWEQNRVSRVALLLEETAAAPERGFEWWYWQRQLHGEVRALRGHAGPVLAVAYSPDGTKIVSASADGTAKVWEAATGRKLVDLIGHNGPIRSAAFFPDGQKIATGGWDRTLRVWDAASGKELLNRQGHEKLIFSVAVSADGRRIATGGFDKLAKVWDAETGEVVATFRGHEDTVWAVAFSPDGKRVVSGGWDKTARVWEAETGKELFALKAHSGPVFAVQFSPDGRRIVTGGQDQRAFIWDAEIGAPLRRLRHSAPVFSVVFFPDGKRVLSAGDDQAARLWDAETGEELRGFKGHGSLIGSVACSPDGRWIITGGGGVRYSPDGSSVAFSTGDDKTVKIWETEGDRDPRALLGHTNAVTSLDFSSDGRLLASASFDGTARLWDVNRGGEGRIIGRHAGPVRSLAFLPGDRRVITGGFDGDAVIWDFATGDSIRLQGHTNRVFSVAASPDGQWVATGSWDNTVKVWHADTGRLEFTFREHSARVYTVAFSPDSRWIVSGAGDGTMRVWAPLTGKVRLSLNNKAYPWSAAFSRDGGRIVTGDNEVTATIWNSAGGEKGLSLKGHTMHLHDAAFSPDGRRIITASADRTAKLWDASTGEELLTLHGHGAWVLAARFSPDGRRIATASTDHTIKIWEAALEEQDMRWQKEGRSSRTESGGDYHTR